MNPKTPALPESELVSLIQKKSIKSFELLYDTYSAPLYSTILKIIPDENIAADALQAAFFEIWKRSESFDAGRMRVFTWVYSVTRSVALSYLPVATGNVSENHSIDAARANRPDVN